MAKTNCPNCGAPIVGSACDYCGTAFENPEKVLALAIGRKVSVSFEDMGRLYEFDMVVDRLDIAAECDTFHSWDGLHVVSSEPRYNAVMNGRLVPSERHGRECMYAVRDLAPEEVTC